MVRHTTCTMSDKATVNQPTVDLLEQAWHKPITSVYCHSHPLQTISQSILGCLPKFENDVVFDRLFSGKSLADKVVFEQQWGPRGIYCVSRANESAVWTNR